MRKLICSTPLSPPLGLSKMVASFKRKYTCFVISCTDVDEFGAHCCCFGCTDSIAGGVDQSKGQGHPLHVNVKQNDVKIRILFYKLSVSNCVIYLFILEVCFAMCWIVVMV